MVVMVLVVGTNANSTSNSSSSGNSTPAPPTAGPTPATSNSDAVTFCPDGGTHVAQVQGLTLATNNSASNSTIYYTTNGAAPTTASTLYTAGATISVTSTTTICAMAVTGGVNGPSTCKTFTITGGTLSSQASAPVFSQNGGAVKVGDKVLVTTSTGGADLYWSASANYSAPNVCGWKSPVAGKLVVNFASTTASAVTISVFAAKAGLLHSEVRTATFSVSKAEEDFSIGLGASRVKFKENEL